jgi:hypothetical protein
MGTVYHARHRLMDRDVVIKVIKPALLENPDILRRFFAEVKAAGQLDHPNIVRAYDAEPAGGLHLFVMEHLEGENLAQVLQNKGPLPVAHACHYIRQVALGLQHASEKGMVHRDIKPANLMLTPRGKVKILDFGLARLASERSARTRLTQVGAVMGTPEYVAPEQALDASKADIRADIYSLGCTLFCLLVGRPPFQGDTLMDILLAQADMNKEAPSVRSLRPDVPETLAAVVAKMLAKDVTLRFQKPVEVAQALVEFCKTGQPAAQPAQRVAPHGVKSSDRGTMMATDTNCMPAPQGAKPGAATRASSSYQNMDRSAGSGGRKGRAAPRGRGWPMRAGIVVIVLGLVVGAWLAAGVLFRVKTPAGIVVLEIDQPGAQVFVDGNKISVQVPGDEQPLQIEVEQGGAHWLKVTKGGFQAFTKEITLQPGKPERIQVKLVQNPVIPPPPKIYGSGIRLGVSG